MYYEFVNAAAVRVHMLLSPEGGCCSRSGDVPHEWLRAESVLSLGVCENRDGWLVAWGLCGSMLIRFSTVWLLPFTLL